MFGTLSSNENGYTQNDNMNADCLEYGRGLDGKAAARGIHGPTAGAVVVYCLLLVTTTVVTTMVIMVVFCTTSTNYDQLLVNKPPTNEKLSVAR